MAPIVGVRFALRLACITIFVCDVSRFARAFTTAVGLGLPNAFDPLAVVRLFVRRPIAPHVFHQVVCACCSLPPLFVDRGSGLVL